MFLVLKFVLNLKKFRLPFIYITSIRSVYLSLKIEKLKLLNFKKLPFLEIDFNDNHNVIIGDNESGKSSILLAIDLAISGSRNKIETLGLDNLFHNKAVEIAMDTNTFNSLPKLEIELFFDGLKDLDFYGRINSTGHDQYESGWSVNQGMN